MNVLGDDIKLENGDITFIPGSGDVDTAYGIDCLIQDIIEELEFPYLDDPDHPDRGNALYCVNVSENRFYIEKLFIKQELTRILSRDPRIKKNSITIKISSNNGYIVASVSFITITNNTIDNLVVPLGVVQ
ncbi:MAG: hypothetical protein Kow00102_15210 [Spirochaetota bacterium]